jgi:hypothetical protein
VATSLDTNEREIEAHGTFNDSVLNAEKSSSSAFAGHGQQDVVVDGRRARRCSMEQALCGFVP